ncbi:hypothetical protein M0805_003368 [Coniferiporia weirii]|nr:hypothetical protein M0805_003368 [Coniferiporia weirii]
MSYFTPPPTAGAPWPRTAQFPQPQPGMTMQPPALSQPALSPSNLQQQNPMFAMMAMMQQMHSLPQTFSQQHAQQAAAPVSEPQKMPMPQASDNSLIAQILYEQTKRGLTYKAALESLHGHNGIAAYAWKDHFLENKQVVDDLVNKIRAHASSVSRVKHEPHTSSSTVQDARNRDSREVNKIRSHSKERATGKEKPKEVTPTLPTKAKRENGADREKPKVKAKEFESEGLSRRTLNSLSSTPAQSLLVLVPPGVPIDHHTGLPAAPPRSPSPPVANPGQKYTDQDEIFFFKRIAYDLARDPDLSKASLCDILAEKAPHHSSLSWRTYWTRKDDVADKMLFLTQLDDEDREKAIQSWKTGTSVTADNASRPRKARRVTYKESSDSESSGSRSESTHSQGKKDSDDNDEDAVGSTDDDEELGEAGTPFTIAETRVLAKHIATVPDWYKGHREWDTFCSTYTQRTPASWKEFYRRKTKDIDVLAKRYIRRTKKERSVSVQRGRPSWLPRTVTPTSLGGDSYFKRRYNSTGSRDRSEDKRARFEGSH